MRPVNWLWIVLAFANALTISGCSLLPRDMVQPDISAKMQAAKGAIGNDDDRATQAQLDVAAELVGESPFLLYPMAGESKERLPDKSIRNLHLSEVSLYDTLKLLLDGTGVALSFDGGHMQGARYQAAMVSSLEGNLPDIIEKLSKAMGFFYRLDSGVLYVTQEEQFALELPPVLNDDSLASLTNTMQYLSAKDVYLDRNSRTLTFKTNRVRLDYIRQYMDRIRSTRSMLVYDLHIFQVDLTDGNQTGIQWNKFNLYGGSLDRSLTDAQTFTGTGSSTAGALAVGVVYNTRHFSLEALINFLKTQGTVRTVSQPRIAIMSGSKGKLRIGQSTRYVSKVGTNTGTAISQTTVETNDLQTGLDMSVYGDLHDGTVYTKLSLSLTNLVQFNRFTALGTDLTLPQTADREYRSTVRTVPGDTILLGGLIQEREAVNVSGLPITDKSIALGSKNMDTSKSELVLVLKARVVKFSKKQVSKQGGLAPAEGKPDKAQPTTGDLGNKQGMPEKFLPSSSVT